MVQVPTIREISSVTPDRDAVYAQLNRLLKSPFFSNSKRYPALLRYIVSHAVEGDSSELKERNLGIEVFGRPADYDTNTDPVVRITAGEIRKRLAQYYCEPEHENELRIELPLGSYVPTFHFPASTLVTIAEPGAASVTPAEAASGAWNKKLTLLVCGLVALGAVLGAGMRYWPRQNALERFWEPLLKGSGPVLICVGQPDRYLGGAQAPRSEPSHEPSLGAQMLTSDRIVMGDAMAVARLTSVLGQFGRPHMLQGSDTTSFVDMQRGPVLLVGGATNLWTVRITDPLRFHLVLNLDDRTLRIEDREHPEKRDWTVDFKVPYSSLAQDYAIVARFFDPTTRQFVMVGAGLGVNGTVSAAEFLADPQYMEVLSSQLPASSAKHQNIEAVISTQVIGNKSGPPRIVAVHSW